MNSTTLMKSLAAEQFFLMTNGNPILHMHMACGREENTVTGCIRNGVKVWQVMEIILTELLENTATRQYDPQYRLQTARTMNYTPPVIRRNYLRLSQTFFYNHYRALLGFSDHLFEVLFARGFGPG